MQRFSNSVIGFLNFFTLLASIPIIGAGLWISRSTTTSIIGLTIFGFAVTSQGGGVEVPSRVYMEYHLEKYSIWLRNKIKDPHYWSTMRSCIMGSNTCSKLASWTSLDVMEKDMSPIQSGCCKPPTSCNTNMEDNDCYRWNNAANILCYNCDSCKAGVLENIRRDWHKISVLSVVVLVFLIGIYSIGCCAFRNARRAQTDYPHGENRMSKVRPRWDYHCWRWFHEKKEQLF
ncbi:unnamed protein product [Vicia faba]|uniref:Tetraspanin-6 n=1 Tax=Vicia faba TaxID=3906 RepID=A0AAV0Z6R3_VICFA|nr:unnamed protein product [Vicia faba]